DAVTERLVGIKPGPVGKDAGDASVEPVEHHPSTGEGIAFPIGHAGSAALAQSDDHEVEPRTAATRELGQTGPGSVGDDHVQVVIGVRGGHAVMGVGALEDESDDGRVGDGEFDERVIGEWLLSSHGVDLRCGDEDGYAWRGEASS